jgi:transcriptional regulator with XRE-family HTH domain
MSRAGYVGHGAIAEAARDAGLKPSYFHRLCSGERYNPSDDKIFRMATAFAIRIVARQQAQGGMQRDILKLIDQIAMRMRELRDEQKENDERRSRSD